jgi:hypothetical protein
MGFVLEPEEAQEWIAADARNADVLFPYLNGEDLSSRPDTSASRWVIDFNDWPEERARKYPLPYARLSERVKPERQRRKPNGSYALLESRFERWWQYGSNAPALRKAIAGLSEVLVIATVSKSVMPMRVPTGQVFSNKLDLFATDSYSDQAILSSSLHQLWAITYGSTLEARVAYTPSYVFETFPFSEGTPNTEHLGQLLHRERGAVMLRRGLGLTRLYNLLNDPAVCGDADVDRLREIHEEHDNAVLAAYGWEDLVITHGFHTFRQTERFTVDEPSRVEILDRLLLLNRERSGL